MFKAYFTEGKNTDDTDALVELGAEIGLDAADLRKTLESSAYADEVKHDIAEASYLGVQGVPFFVFNRKYAISGAQAPEVFEQTLERAFNEWRKDNPMPAFEVIEGPSCGPDGEC